jgi:hypothetical protein
MESLFDLLSAFEFRPRHLNIRIARENRFSRTAVCSSIAFSWAPPATANAAANVSSSGGRASLPVAIFNNNSGQFWHFRPQSLDIGLFCGLRRIALDRPELLLDRRPKACGCVYEHVQRCAGECRRDQAKENNCPKNAAFISGP